LHNHTTFSDGSWSAFELITKGIEARLVGIGIADHFNTYKAPSISPEDLPGYISHLRDLKDQFKDRIKVFAGIEIDSCPERSPLLFDLPFEELSKLDFALFEYVGDKLWNGISVDDFLKIRKNIDTKVGLAHWYAGDILKIKDRTELANLLRENDIFIEITPAERYNIDGSPYYQLLRDFYEQLASSDIKFSIGSDTHEDIDGIGQVDDEIQFLKDINGKIIELS